MASECFRVPETLDPDGASESDLLNDWIHANNPSDHNDDVQSLAERAQEQGSQFEETILNIITMREQTLDADNIEDIKFRVYLGTLLFFRISEETVKECQLASKRGKAKNKTAAAAGDTAHTEVVWQLLEQFKNITSLPKSTINEVVHGMSLIQFCQQMALKVAARCGRACQHKDNVAAILASAETFDTVERVATDMKLFLEEDREGPALVPAISKRCAALGREVLAQVVEDMGCMEGKDSRVSSFKDYLTEMSKSCMDLLGPNLMFLHRILQSEKDTFATTILHCFQQYAMQGCAEPTAEADPEETSCSAKNIVEAFKTRTLDKTCAVRITALQCIGRLAENGVLTAEMFPSTTDCTRDRLVDRLVSVRKQALQTMEALITRNPFGHVLSHEAAMAHVEQEVRALATRRYKQKSVRRVSMMPPPPPTQDEDAVGDASKDDEENCNPNAMEEDAQTKEDDELQQVLEKHKPRLAFLKAVDRVVPELELLLARDEESDVSGAVGLLKYLRAFDVPGASSALTKALKLVSSSLPSARGVIVDMFTEVYLSNKADHAAVVAGLLQLLQSEPSLALERAIKKCMELALDGGAEVAMHSVAVVCISTAHHQMIQERPQPQDVHRAELCLRLLTVFAEMKPQVCCGQLEELLKIRTCVLRVNNMGGTKGVLLHNALVNIIMLMARDPTCRAEVLKPEALKRIVIALLTVRGQHCLTLTDAAVKGLVACVCHNAGAINGLLTVLKRLALASEQQIIKVQQQVASPPAVSRASVPVQDESSAGCGPDSSVDGMDCDAEPPAADVSAHPAESAGTPPQVDVECPRQPCGDAALASSSAQQQRMELAQSVHESEIAKKRKDASDPAMAGVFHCEDPIEQQGDLQKELLAGLRTASKSVLRFCKSALLLRANTSLRLHACICIMRLANIDDSDNEVAAEALQIMFILLHHGNRAQVEPVVAKQIVNGLADLLYNKPSLMMHYSKQFFEILVQDHHQHMRLHVTQMVIKLVLSGVLRFKEGVGKLIFLLVDTDAQVQRQVEHLFKKLHEQDKNTIFSVFPDVLQSLSNSNLQPGQKDQIITILSPFVTADKQNRNLIDCMLARMMVELPDISDAKYCLQGVWMLKSGAENYAAIIKAIYKVSVVVPQLGEKLEDQEFAKLLLETANKALEMLKRARKADEVRLIEMQAAVSQVQDLVASCLDDEAPDDSAEGAATDEIEQTEDVEMEDSEAVDTSQVAAQE